MNPEALILRRCYPVPVTFADLRAAYDNASCHKWVRDGARITFTASLKAQTSAIDEVYAVVDGREVYVGAVHDAGVTADDFDPRERTAIGKLLTVADDQGYWERPREVRIDLSPWPVSHSEVTKAVLVGQEALERGVVRS